MSDALRAGEKIEPMDITRSSLTIKSGLEEPGLSQWLSKLRMMARVRPGISTQRFGDMPALAVQQHF